MPVDKCSFSDIYPTACKKLKLTSTLEITQTSWSAMASSFSLSSSSLRAVQLRVENTVASSNCCFRTQVISGEQRKGKGRSVWRRRKLTKKDDMLRYKMERVPFLEEQVRKVKDGGQLLGMDIERLLLSEDNRFDFVNEIAAEANEYVENNRDEYGGKKKAILHVLSNRVNDAGFYRPEAYEESDPFKPGPSWLKEFYT